MRAKIVLNTFGSLGDLYPFLALAKELNSRGHTSILAANKAYQKIVESQNIHFVPIRPEPLDLASKQELSQKIFSSNGIEFLLGEILFPNLQKSYDDLSNITKKSDLLISHPFSFAAPLVKEVVGIPWISTVLSPISLLSACDPPLFNPKLNLKFFPSWFNSFIISSLKNYSYKLSEPLQQFRRKIGLSPINDPFFQGQQSSQLILGLFSPEFAAPQPDWAKCVYLSGFPFYEPQDAILPHDLVKFINSGSPPIIFTLGSAAVENAGNFYQQSALTAKKLNERAILLVGNNPANIPHNLISKSIMAVEYTFHFLLFPHARAIVHQGGIGTVAQTLKAGKPSLIVPFGQDQFDNADRVQRLGIGKTIAKNQYNFQQASLTLNKLLSNPEVIRKAKSMGKKISQEQGVINACDKIEFFLFYNSNKK